AETLAGEFVIAANEAGAAGECGRVGIAANLEISGPDAVDAKAGDLQIAARDLHIELPRVKLFGLDHVGLIEPDFLHVELRDCCGGGGLAQREAAAVQVKIAGNGAAGSARLDLERPGAPCRNIVAIEKQ